MEKKRKLRSLIAIGMFGFGLILISQVFLLDSISEFMRVPIALIYSVIYL